MSRPRVTIACCNGTGWLHKSVAFAAMRMVGDQRVTARFIAPTHSPFVQNLHKACADFLASGDDFLLLVDDDNPPLRNPLDLVSLDLDVVGLPTPVWHCDGETFPYYPNAMRKVKDGYKPITVEGVPTGLVEVDAVGTGCCLIARRVLVELFTRCEGNPAEAPFMRRWNDRGLVEAGNDFAFCDRARAAGFRVWAHFGFECDHYKELPLREVAREIVKSRG